MNETGLRNVNEPILHKILDVIGDMYLAGQPIIGCFEGYNSGHELNRQLLLKLFSDDSNWCYI